MDTTDWTLIWEIYDRVNHHPCRECKIKSKSMYVICPNYDYMPMKSPEVTNSRKAIIAGHNAAISVCIKCMKKHNPYIDDQCYAEYSGIYHRVIIYSEITVRNEVISNPDPESKIFIEKQLPNRKL